MSTQTLKNPDKESKKGFRLSHVLWIILATIILTAASTYWVIQSYVFAKDFTPVVLKQDEEMTLNKKLKQLGFTADSDYGRQTPTTTPGFDSTGNLLPEAYSETGARHEVSLTERELNSLLAKNTELARKLAIDLSSDLISGKLLVPVDPDFPVLGGKTLRVSAGLEVAYQNSKPVVILKGVSIMGIPIPNAWLGGMKNIDLVKEFSVDEGFWKAFSEGVENIRVKDGRLLIRLKE